MPWSGKQVRTFRAIEHGWRPRKGSLRKISPEKAGEMADEGIRGSDAAEALSRRRRKRKEH